MGGLVLALALGGCENPTEEDDGPSAQKLVNEFRDAWSEILLKTAGIASLSDESAVDAALTAWVALNSNAQALASGEKARLDSLKTEIDTLKAARFDSLDALQTHLTEKPVNDVDNPYAAAYTGDANPADIYAALDTGGRYVKLDLSQSSAGEFVSGTETGRAYIVSLVLPDSLTETPNGTGANYIFKGFTSLKAVSATGLVTLGDSAFTIQNSLTTVFMPKVTTIGSSVFQNCTSLTTVYMPKLEILTGNAFSGCTSLVEIDLPRATNIGKGSFMGCTGLARVNLPAADFIGSATFDGDTSLTTLSLPNVTAIGGGSTFRNCSNLVSVYLPKLRDFSGASVFQNDTSLITVSLPEAVTVDSMAFDGCTSLTMVDLPKVTYLGNAAFKACSSLTTVVLGDTPPTVGTEMFFQPLFRSAAVESGTIITFKVPGVAVYTAAGSPWNDKIGFNGETGYFWDDMNATKDNLTVALAPIN
jgi:hypothetical protein